MWRIRGLESCIRSKFLRMKKKILYFRVCFSNRRKAFSCTTCIYEYNQSIKAQVQLQMTSQRKLECRFSSMDIICITVLDNFGIYFFFVGNKNNTFIMFVLYYCVVWIGWENCIYLMLSAPVLHFFILYNFLLFFHDLRVVFFFSQFSSFLVIAQFLKLLK